MSFGTKLQDLRREKRISQEELAERLNVSRQAISRWENDKGYPEVDKLIQMSELFEVSIDYLIKDEDLESEIPEERNHATSYDVLDLYISSRFTNIRNKSLGLLLLLLTLPLSVGLGNTGVLISIILLIVGTIIFILYSKKDKIGKYFSDDVILSSESKDIIKEEISKKSKLCQINISLGIILFFVGIASTFILTNIYEESLLWMYNNQRNFIVVNVMFLITGIFQIFIYTSQLNVYKYISERFQISIR